MSGCLCLSVCVCGHAPSPSPPPIIVGLRKSAEKYRHGKSIYHWNLLFCLHSGSQGSLNKVLMSLSPFPAPPPPPNSSGNTNLHCYTLFTLRLGETSPPPLPSGRRRDAGEGRSSTDRLTVLGPLFTHPGYRVSHLSPGSTAGKTQGSLQNERRQIPIQFHLW